MATGKASGARVMNALAGAHDANGADDRHLDRPRESARCLHHPKQKAVHGPLTGRIDQLHALVDANGLPVRLALTAREAHDNRLAGKLLSRLTSGTMLLVDRGYDHCRALRQITVCAKPSQSHQFRETLLRANGLGWEHRKLESPP